MTTPSDTTNTRPEGTVRALISHRDTISLLVRQELKTFYGRYRFGIIWVLADPLSQAVFMGIVFAFIIGRGSFDDVSPFMVYLLTGLLPLAWLQSSISKSTKAFTRLGETPATSALPEIVWPLRVVLLGMMDFVLALPAILILGIPFFIFTGTPTLTWGIILFPLGLVMQLFLCLGLAMGSASMGIGFPDVDRLTGLLNRFFFWMSPVLWVKRDFPEPLEGLLYLNPFHGILDFYRAMFWPDLLAGPIEYLTTIGVIGAVFALGLLMMRARMGRIRRMTA